MSHSSLRSVSSAATGVTRITHIEIRVPANRYYERMMFEGEDEQYFAEKHGLTVILDVIEGNRLKIRDHEKGKCLCWGMKVVDEGTYEYGYEFQGKAGKYFEENEYVPAFLPSEYDDYLYLITNEDGILLNPASEEAVEFVLDQDHALQHVLKVRNAQEVDWDDFE